MTITIASNSPVYLDFVLNYVRLLFAGDKMLQIVSTVSTAQAERLVYAMITSLASNVTNRPTLTQITRSPKLCVIFRNIYGKLLHVKHKSSL